MSNHEEDWNGHQYELVLIDEAEWLARRSKLRPTERAFYGDYFDAGGKPAYTGAPLGVIEKAWILGTDTDAPLILGFGLDDKATAHYFLSRRIVGNDEATHPAPVLIVPDRDQAKCPHCVAAGRKRARECFKDRLRIVTMNFDAEFRPENDPGQKYTALYVTLAAACTHDDPSRGGHPLYFVKHRIPFRPARLGELEPGKLKCVHCGHMDVPDHVGPSFRCPWCGGYHDDGRELFSHLRISPRMQGDMAAAGLSAFMGAEYLLPAPFPGVVRSFLQKYEPAKAGFRELAVLAVDLGKEAGPDAEGAYGSALLLVAAVVFEFFTWEFGPRFFSRLLTFVNDVYPEYLSMDKGRLGVQRDLFEGLSSEGQWHARHPKVLEIQAKIDGKG